MGFHQERIKYVDPDEMNKILEKIEKVSPIKYEAYKRSPTTTLTVYSYVNDKPANLEVTTKWYDGKPCKYVLYKPTGEVKTVKDPLSCYRTLCLYHNPSIKDNPDLMKNFAVTESGTLKPSASPIIGYNEKYNRKETYAYGYDLNSAYSSAMYDKMPDTTKYRYNDFVGENEVGFLFDEKLSMVKTGKFANIVFPLADSPYRKFVDVWYNKKKNAKTPEEKQKAKNTLNNSVGYLQRTNPFHRSYIINTCNEKIKSLLDDNSIMWNTDAIYSATKRDFEIGTGLGKWKLEYEGNLRIVGDTYQLVDTSEVHYRHVPTAWFSKDYNLLTDKIPDENNMYYYNKEENRICLSLTED